MSDRLRLITIGIGGQVTTVRDYEDGVSWQKARSSFKWTAPPAKAISTNRDRRFAGGRTVAESHDNAVISWMALVTGTSADNALANVSLMVTDLRYAAGQRFIEWRPDGATLSTLYEIRGPAVAQTNYDWAQFVGAKSLTAEVQIPVAPLPRGLPMDVLDDFSVDTESDYTFDASTAADVATTGSAMTPVVGAALSVERRARHTIRGYTHLDAQATAHGAPGSTISSFKLGRTLRASANTYVEVYVDDNGANSRLRVDVILAGVRTNRATSNLVARVSNGTEFWVRGRIEGNTVYSEYFTSQPTPMSTPTLTGTAYTLTSAEQTSLVAGNAGWSWIPIQAAAVVYDLQDEPFTYRNRTLPEELRLNGTIPGDAPALADVTITTSGAGNAPIFALIGWTERPSTVNWCWNGDFEDTGTDGWVGTGGLLTGTAVLSRVTTASKFGSASLQAVTPATASSGADFKAYRRFKAGITYTFSAWVRSAAGTTTVQVIAGTGADTSASSAVALSTTWTQHTVTWVPTADRDIADFAIRQTAATITTFTIDAVQIYEGTTAPTVGREPEGAGGIAPFGILEAEAVDTGDLTGWAIVSNAAYRMGTGVGDAVVAGAETYTAGWWVDPHLMVPDDFTLGEIDVEIWARVLVESTVVSPRGILSARPESGTSFGAERFTAEWGQAGKLLPRPSAGAGYRRTRLGTLTFPVDPVHPARWKIWLAASTATGSTGGFGIDFLTMLPARYRCSSPSGKINDATYPKFVTSTAETSKTILADLRGLVAKPPLAPTGDRGLGGSPLELPPGNIDLLVDLSSLVPDDPTSDSTAESFSSPATVHVAVWPRFHAYRSS